jgi:hypothetical protein
VEERDVVDAAALDQEMDYALDLKNVHAGSNWRQLVPIVVATGAEANECPLIWTHDGAPKRSSVLATIWVPCCHPLHHADRNSKGDHRPHLSRDRLAQPDVKQRFVALAFNRLSIRPRTMPPTKDRIE